MTAPENHLEILIFPDESEDSSTSLNTCLNRINSVVEKYSKDYIWHMDKLTFEPKNVNCHSDTFTFRKDSLPPYLYTSLCFGENVEDEWFTLYILFQLTEEIPGIVIRVWDSDGEFLLIEAADHLDSWCNPESCSEKVFLYKGNVHIVENKREKNQEKEYRETNNINEMLSFIRTNEEKTKASSQVQNDIHKRMQGYPEKIQDQIHHAHAFVPISVAKVLKAQPHLISHATRAFCLRDALDMKAVKNFPHFGSEPKVMQRVKFTKCLYAMLMSSQYVHPSSPSQSNPNYKTHSIGIKLMCGFEILLAQVQDREGKCQKQWTQYLSSLHKKGYFKDLLEGSKEYKELESMAREFYLKNQADTIGERTVGNDIMDLIQNSSLELGLEEKLEPSDDDAWMSISSNDLDLLLQERFGLPGDLCIDPSRNDAVASAINKFLHHSSGVEGAEFPHGYEEDQSSGIATHSEENKSGRTSKTVTFQQDRDSIMDVSDNENDVDFQLDEFSAAITKMLDALEQKAGADDETGSESELSGEDSDDYMKVMEQELSGTTMAESFVKKDDDDTVDIDMNALQNVIASYEAQIGTPGPASNVLNPMGINMRALLEKKNAKQSPGKSGNS
uniref:Protein ecdysoneless homolog n=1 Tax=Cacopsylla melanoneura TaxID=428564 RepID=A0A8D9AJ19_9HEMI